MLKPCTVVLAHLNHGAVEDVKAARDTIAQHICRTPVVQCEQINKLAGRSVLMKAECLQVTGSFKIRGATFAVHNALQHGNQDSSSATGVYTHSSGNHGAALAHAARTADTSATIIMPNTAPECKVSAARGSGATVVMCEPTMQARQDAATAHSNENPNDTFIPPYNHPHTIAGQGTVGLELLEQVYTGEIMCIGTAAGVSMPGHTAINSTAQEGSSIPSAHTRVVVPPLDAVVVPVSGGGLISGIATAVKHLSPNCKVYWVGFFGATASTEHSGELMQTIYSELWSIRPWLVIGAEPLGSNNMADAHACMAAGDLVKLPEAPDTIADGLRAALGDLTWPIVRDKVESIIPVTEKEIITAMRLLMDKAKLVVEPSGAAPLAAVLSERFQEDYGSFQNVAVVLSGGNVDFDRVGFWKEWGECAGVN